MPTIISNYANDTIEYKNNYIIKGGPAFYIEKYYKNNNLEYDLVNGGNNGDVLILNNNGNDVGIIKYAPKIYINNKLKSDFFIISTLLDEFKLSDISKLDGLIFCDIQGYIRELNSPNRLLIDYLPGLDKVQFLKIADYEYQFLTNNLIFKYINGGGVIIITTGSKGIVKFITTKGEKVINIPVGNFVDTIGAGDTFLASFADNYYKYKDIEKAIINSSNYVYEFLKIKNNIY